jgi:gliding motility-associated-like protein
MVSPTENTLYSLTAEYDSLPGCYGQTHYIAVLLENNNLWIPNVFTPGRESNNTFSVNANELSYYHITIFNRLGMKVFHSDDINQPWDGTCNGLLCPTGTYTYTIDYSTNNSPNELLHHTGTVTLIR